MITSISPKLKKGTAHIYNNATVFVFHDRMDGRVVVSHFADYSNEFVVDRDELKPLVKLRTPIKSSRTLTPEKKAEKSELDQFFDQMALVVPAVCDNCNMPLNVYTKKARRSVTAHILPKAKFESIATNPLNVVFMGADYIGCPCNCHDRWDATVENRVTMPIYKTALERFEVLKHEIPADLLKAAYTYLNITWS